MLDREFSDIYNLYFKGKYKEIDPTTLATSLISLNTIVDEINQELQTNKRIELRVKPFSPGSFEVPIEFIQIAIPSFLSATNIAYIKKIVEYIVILFNLWRHLKGSPPKDIKQIGDKAEIINKEGNTFAADNLTVNIYKNNMIVNEAIQNKFQRLEQDDTIDDFQIKDNKKKTIINIPHDEFKYFSKYPKEEEPQSKTKKEKVQLHIHKVVFDNRSQWDFYHKGIRIPAKIQDDVFNEKVIAGEKFANGDILEVEIEIDQEFDKKANTYVNKAYRITKVVKHIPRDEQTNFEF